MSSTGRRNAAYLAAAREFQRGQYPCALHYDHTCKRIGHTVEHDPPLSTFPNPAMWKGRYLPACSRCQSIQGARITNARRTQTATPKWVW